MLFFEKKKKNSAHFKVRRAVMPPIFTYCQKRGKIIHIRCPVKQTKRFEIYLGNKKIISLPPQSLYKNVFKLFISRFHIYSSLLPYSHSQHNPQTQQTNHTHQTNKSTTTQSHKQKDTQINTSSKQDIQINEM